MELLALIVWLLLAATAALLLPAAITVPGAGLLVLADIAGLGGCVLFILLDAPSWAAWAQVGAAAVALAGGVSAAAVLCDGSSTTGSRVEEVAASVVGLQLPFLGALLFAALLLALTGIATVV